MNFRGRNKSDVISNSFNIEAPDLWWVKKEDLPMYAPVPFEDYAIVIEKDLTVRKFEDLAKTNYRRIMNGEPPLELDKDNKKLQRLFKDEYFVLG